MERLEKPQLKFYANQGLKICRGCYDLLGPRPISEFNVNRKRRDGLEHRCRKCMSAKTKVRVVCPDCGIKRMSLFAANRCGVCHKLRAFARREFVQFRWPRDFYKQAIELLRQWSIPWPEAERRLTALCQSALSDTLEAADNGFDWFKHVSFDAPVYSDSHATRYDRVEQSTFERPDSFIDREEY